MNKFNRVKSHLKALICAGLIALSSTGCIEHNSTHKVEARNNRVVHVETLENGYERTNPLFRIQKVEYEGHTYLYFLEQNGRAGFAGITHDENCKCRKGHVQDN